MPQMDGDFLQKKKQKKPKQTNRKRESGAFPKVEKPCFISEIIVPLSCDLCCTDCHHMDKASAGCLQLPYFCGRLDEFREMIFASDWNSEQLVGRVKALIWRVQGGGHSQCLIAVTCMFDSSQVWEEIFPWAGGGLAAVWGRFKSRCRASVRRLMAGFQQTFAIGIRKANFIQQRIFFNQFFQSFRTIYIKNHFRQDRKFVNY